MKFVNGKYRVKRYDSITSKVNGHEVLYVNGEWIYRDDYSPLYEGEDRPCGKCGLLPTLDGHDACIANLPNVLNACCGHGVLKESYVMLSNGAVYRQIEPNEMVRLCGFYNEDIDGLMIELNSITTNLAY